MNSKDTKIKRKKDTKITEIEKYKETKKEKYKDTKTQIKRFNNANCLRRQFSHHTDTTCVDDNDRHDDKYTNFW